MGLRYHLSDSYIKNYAETPNCHQKFEMFAFKSFARYELNGPYCPDNGNEETLVQSTFLLT